MKKCPKCNVDVDDNFDVCWNCQYSFIENKVLEITDFNLICPNCNREIKTSLRYCPHCQFDLKDINKEMETKPQGPKKIDCLRCKVPLDFQGNFKFHEGKRMGVLGNLFELFVNKESFDLYSCPNCGKIEFFIPGFD